MLDRRVFIGTLTATLVGARGRAIAQQSGKLPRVGVLVSATPPHPFADALRRGLQPLGYVEGENIAIEWRYTEGRSDRAAAFAAELVELRVDVIVAHLTPAVRATMVATQTIPIIMAPAGAPVQSGLIDSLAHPGGNVTGLSAMDAELGGKRLQLLRDVVPNLARVAVLASSGPFSRPFVRPFVDDMEAAATIAGIRLVPVLVNGPDDFENAFAAMTKAEAQAVIVQGLFDPHRAMILELAAKHRLPIMSGNRATASAGGLISYSANFVALYERAALYAGKILKGAKAADLPVEQPTTFELVVNLKTANMLGLTPSRSLLAQADEVIE
jgi:putative tryptophan/tyrosine transport system substrate-binding protein